MNSTDILEEAFEEAMPCLKEPNRSSKLWTQETKFAYEQFLAGVMKKAGPWFRDRMQRLPKQ